MTEPASARTRPNVFQYIGYCYGRRLPNSMRQWVADDLAGPGATIRMMVRVFIPAVLILTPFWIIPMSLYLHLSTTLPILIPFVFFSHALNKVWRRHMLRKHGLDPGLVDYVARQRNAHVHDAYIEKYGPRSGPPSSQDV
jgi:hypothetical protein